MNLNLSQPERDRIVKALEFSADGYQRLARSHTWRGPSFTSVRAGLRREAAEDRALVEKIRKAELAPVTEYTPCPRCGMRKSDPRHEELPDGCRAHTEHGTTGGES